jgi:hypothetical protein
MLTVIKWKTNTTAFFVVNPFPEDPIKSIATTIAKVNIITGKKDQPHLLIILSKE